ncbi:Histone-lysine N-methyltransferase ATX1 [Apostasia shenzhenica]|uniref:Histone-lysine N-methyltransferase ATX1 n=1 Tax=Apostasia shenzhenica TaxID=1088818 RepID=A0A2I0A0S9_9ASPA|nr:Histone-lysine N-methyltransferase ATX1 [Apostasia shenzhenica]
MTGGRWKRRRTTGEGSDGGSGAMENPSASPPTCGDGTPPATSSTVSGVDLYAQARKALTERCPFDGEERAPGAWNLPSALAAILHRHTDGRRKHRKVQEDAAGKATGPVRPPPRFSVWEVTEEFFRPISLEDIDLLGNIFPPNSCFYIPDVGNVVEEVEKDEAVHAEIRPVKEVEKDEAVHAEIRPVEEDVSLSSLKGKEGMKTCVTALPAEGAEVEDDKSLNWILGCRQRFLLTSERPSKKRKRLGGEAGLKQMLSLPSIQEEAEAESPLCDICCSGESGLNANRILICGSCKAAVHQKCYGVRGVPEGEWLCAWCKHIEAVRMKSENTVGANGDSITPCLLCPKAGGALKPVGGNLGSSEDTKFVHLFCSLWAPEVYVEDVGAMEPVMNIGGVQESRRKLVCNLCKERHGVCVRCSNGSCRTSLHPACAREAKHKMEIWGNFGDDNVELRAFCSKHSSVPETDSFQSSELPSSHTDAAVVIGKLLPKRVPIKRLPKLRLSCRSKDKIMAQDGSTNLASDKVAEMTTKFDQEPLAPKVEPDGGVSQPNIVVDGGNAFPNADVIRIFRKLAERRKINVFDVASELGVSSASLESIAMGEGDSFPGELRLKLLHWLQNVVHVQPSTRQFKSRNGSTVSSGSLAAKVDVPAATYIHGTEPSDPFKLPEITDTLLVKMKPSARTTHDKNNAEDNHEPSSSGELLQDNSEEFVGEIDGDISKQVLGVTNCTLCSTNNEDCHHKEDNLAKTMIPKPTGFPGSDSSKEQLCEDKPEGSDFRGMSDRSNAVVKNDQWTGADFTQLKKNGLAYRDDADALHESSVKQVACGSRLGIHPFILKRLIELQNQWQVLCNDRNKEPGSTDTLLSESTIRSPMSNTTELDQSSTAKKMMTLELLPVDEVEGELLYLQNLLLNKANSIKHSCSKPSLLFYLRCLEFNPYQGV